ncbi:MAG TPA: hypothetical protein VKA46_02090 [Gemmataceae bacterium]|nr:hypothetical protein [Gemmataceae bacterium]
MEPGGLPELVALRTLLQKACLAEEVRHGALWCLDQLPQLYADFCRNYESRFGDGILRLVRAILKRLAEGGTGDDAGRVALALVARLDGLHVRLGLPPLALKPAVPVVRRAAGKPR